MKFKSMKKMGIFLILILIGLIAGILSGLIGIGGGVIVIPALIFMLGFSQQTAQGTTLALMVPPIGLLAAYAYYKEGYVDVYAAAIICIGFVAGSYFGAKYAAGISEVMMRKIFSVILFVIAIKMFFTK